MRYLIENTMYLHLVCKIFINKKILENYKMNCVVYIVNHCNIKTISFERL